MEVNTEIGMDTKDMALENFIHSFRTTILPPTEQLKEMLNLFRDFHQKFMKEYK